MADPGITKLRTLPECPLLHHSVRIRKLKTVSDAESPLLLIEPGVKDDVVIDELATVKALVLTLEFDLTSIALWALWTYWWE